MSFVLLVLLAPRPAPGTVEEQRARLPPPARCTDEIEGVWMAHHYLPRWGWFVRHLEIQRADGIDDALEGRIVIESWTGRLEDQEPPLCSENGLHYRLTQEAQGRYADGAVEFWGTQWEIDEIFCGRWTYSGYNLDNFSGTLVPELEEFQSVNNDGGTAVNEPTVFRRIACYALEDPEQRRVPPPYVPTRHAGGCRCWI